MSHRWDCPDRYEAERRGERDQEWGRSRSSNPYDDHFHPERECEEAADAWRSGYRRAEMREEERHEEEAAAQRAAWRQAEAEAEEAYAYELAVNDAQLKRDYEADLERQHEADMQQKSVEDGPHGS